VIRRLLAQHYHRRAHAAGTATLLAQMRRDWPQAARCMARMHKCIAKRDRLLQGLKPRCNP
jgi:hypothetical protein